MSGTRGPISELRTERLTLAYDGTPIVSDLTLAIPDGRITALVGPNACGKSTLLRGLARMLRPRAGAVYLDGREIHRYPTREVALRLGLLPQAPSAPEGLTVEELVARGRYPHQTWFRQWSVEDEAAAGLGLQPERDRLALLAVAVALAAVSVAIAGPIGFVAFIAPHLARRLARASGSGILPAAAAIGGLLLIGSDILARRILDPSELPVGILTVVLGAPYFLWLLARGPRAGGAA